jgi:hypothetical protein
MWAMFKTVFWSLLQRVRRTKRGEINGPIEQETRDVSDSGSESGTPLAEEIEAPPPPPSGEASEETAEQSEAEATGRGFNRKQRRSFNKVRRHYEKQRLKFDQFVEPKGPKPVVPAKSPPVPRPPKPQPPEPLDHDAHRFENQHLVIDVHHSDRKTKVLYEHTEMLGQFNFRDTILDQLDRYFFYLARMRRHDPDAYYLYGQVGGVLLPFFATPDLWNLDSENDPQERQMYLSTWFMHTRPTFGCVAYATSSEAEKIERQRDKGTGKNREECWIPKFMYFHKYDRSAVPAEIQPVRKAGDIYKLTVWWDRKDTVNKRHKWGKPDDYGVFIDPDGNVRVLKTLEPQVHRLPKGGRYQEMQWRIPHHQEEYAAKHNATAQRFVSNLFVETTKRWEGASAVMAKVSVRKEGQYACFGVDIHRLPYFFKDRDYVLGPKGTRKPIVHLVRPHVRADGSVAKMQVRGEQKFTWAGYDVEVTIPGLDHHFWEEMNIAVLDDRKAKAQKLKDLRDMKSLGKTIRDNIEGKPFSE